MSAARLVHGPHNGPMAFFLPSPRAVVELSRYAVGQVVESAAAAATIPVRVFQVLGQVELMVNRISLAAERAEGLIDRAEAVVGEAEKTVDQTRVIVAAAALAVDEAATVAAGAASVVNGAAAVVDGAQEVSEGAADAVRGVVVSAAEAAALLTLYGPTLRKAAPMARRFVEELSHDEVTAAIRVIDELPRLRDHLANDVMPLLGTLDRMGPDMHALLEVTRDLNLAVAGIPGLRMLRRRGEDKVTEEEPENGH